ncbi:hypothetical protein Dimus_013415 [Dionaea muscipula]
MLDHGLSNVMEVIKRQKWKSLFKRRELVHTDAIKEFYAKLIMSHNRKKDVAKSKVRGVEIVFDHLQLASILGVPGNNEICQYIKEVWEESKYTKPLEITRRFANDESIMEARRIKSVEMKPFQRFVHFLVMKNVVPRFGKRDTTSYMDLIYMDHLIARRKEKKRKKYDLFEETFLTMCKLIRENGVWWIGTGQNRGRDDDDEVPEEEAEEEEENQTDFDWEAVVDEAAVEGESGSGEKFYDAEDEVQGSPEVNDELPAVVTQASAQQKELGSSGVDPSGPSGHLPEAVMNKLQAEFERARANRFQADLEKAQAENARLLVLLQQAQTKPKP